VVSTRNLKWNAGHAGTTKEGVAAGVVRNIAFRNRSYRRIRLQISSRARFHEILRIVNSIEYPGDAVDSEQVNYALLELLNNSLRAHRDKNIDRNILAEMWVIDGSLHVRVTDWGGGFDPASLPHDLNGQVHELDPNDEVFVAYREKHGYRRFGMGLYIAKRTFPRFDLHFFDEEQNRVDWGTGRVSGTCIDMAIGGSDER
jgi:anti-sigma regulatory factor (Ser/Thr protein kinase)